MKVINCETKTTVKNKKTGKVYASENEAQSDIADKSSATVEDDIQRDVNVIVPNLDLKGDTD
jgi:hypothetical protein|tara:strand:+ start:1459 stop:1644 length:186 start_codon:yes stop_codon:yes gene_type:complete